jgi:outer membrane lipopolysaccharide assembly protein LptE/RlpB
VSAREPNRDSPWRLAGIAAIAVVALLVACSMHFQAQDGPVW